MRSKAFFERQERMKVLSDGSVKPQFYEGSRKIVQRTLTDERGNILENKNIEIPSKRPLPDSHFLHDGELVSDYDVENLQKAGIQLQPFTGSFVQLSLDELSHVSDVLESECIQSSSAPAAPAVESTQPISNTSSTTEV